MNTPSASRAEALVDTPRVRPVLVWDAPVRVFHWLTVLSFAGAWLTAESERWRLVHVTLGYTMVGLVAFRVLWGLVGTRHARFASFVRSPAAAWHHLRDMVAGRHDSAVGHNPAGALAIVAMLGLTLAIGASGWALYEGGAPNWAEELHEALANGLLALVGLHIAGVLTASAMARRNLVRGMVTGRLPGRPEDAIGSAWRSLAALMVVAVLAFWALQWQAAPAVPPAGLAAQAHGDHRD